MSKKPRKEMPVERALKAARVEIENIRKAADTAELSRILKKLKRYLDVIFAPHVVLLLQERENRAIGGRGPKKPRMQCVVQIMGVEVDVLDSTRIALVYLQTTEPDDKYRGTNRYIVSEDFSVRKPDKLLKLLRQALKEATAQLEERLGAAKGLLTNLA